MEYAPVVIFAYNRRDNLEMCLNTVGACKESKSTDLYIFCDGSKGLADIESVKEVQEYVSNYSLNNPFKKTYVYISEGNKGLAQSIIEGVSKIIKKYGRIIVLEDDLIVAEDFLDYMNRGLRFYENYKQYGSINGYTYPIKTLNKYSKDIYITRKADCWGWGTWIDRWEGTDWMVKDFDSYVNNPIERLKFEKLESGLDKMLIMQQKGETSSWAVRWVYSLYKRGLLSVYPSISRVGNIGHDGRGEHKSTSKCFAVELSNKNNKCEFELLQYDKKLERACSNYIRSVKIHDFLEILVSKMRFSKAN